MSTRAVSDIVSATSTAVLAVCALVVTSLVVRRNVGDSSGDHRRPPVESQADWRSYSSGGHRLGSPDAPVLLIEFADFQCPACRVLEGRLRDVRKRFPRELAVLFRHFPLKAAHPFAEAAAVASECAARQGKFEQMHELLFDKSDSIGVLQWTEFARRATVPDIATFNSCLADPASASNVDADLQAALQLKAQGTPTMLVDGIRLNGAPTQHTLDSVIALVVRRTVDRK